jgi:hypothetical protein
MELLEYKMILEYKNIVSFLYYSKEYIFFLLVAAFVLFQKRKQSITYFVALLILFSSTRGGFGPDFSNYYKWYITSFNDKNLEIGYVGLMNLFAYLGLSFFHLQFFISVITITLVFLAFKKYKINNKYAGFFFVITPYFYLYSFIIIRQYLAMAIVFFAFNYLLSKENMKYIFAIFLGSLIHYSCLLVGILIWFLMYFSPKISRMHLLLFLAASIPFAYLNWVQFFAGFFEGTKYYGYFLHKNTIPINYIKLILFNIEALFLLYFYKDFINYNSRNKYFIVLTIFTFILANIFAPTNYMSRFSKYFKFFELILIADLVVIKRKQPIIFLILVFYNISLFFNVLWVDYKSPGKHTKLVPYKNILFNR